MNTIFGTTKVGDNISTFQKDELNYHNYVSFEKKIQKELTFAINNWKKFCFNLIVETNPQLIEFSIKITERRWDKIVPRTNMNENSLAKELSHYYSSIIIQELNKKGIVFQYCYQNFKRNSRCPNKIMRILPKLKIQT